MGFFSCAKLVYGKRLRMYVRTFRRQAAREKAAELCLQNNLKVRTVAGRREARPLYDPANLSYEREGDGR